MQLVETYYTSGTSLEVRKDAQNRQWCCAGVGVSRTEGIASVNEGLVGAWHFCGSCSRETRDGDHEAVPERVCCSRDRWSRPSCASVHLPAATPGRSYSGSHATLDAIPAEVPCARDWSRPEFAFDSPALARQGFQKGCGVRPRNRGCGRGIRNRTNGERAVRSSNDVNENGETTDAPPSAQRFRDYGKGG